jgi:hypothetical protein
VERTHQTDATWDAFQAAIEAGAATVADPTASQADVDAAIQAIAEAISALRYDYPVDAGFGAWTGSGTASARIDASAAKFTDLTLNGATVPATAYTVTANTVITLHEAYLLALTPGVYSFYAEFRDGVSGPLTVTVAAADKPDDSDGDNGSDDLPVTGGACLPTIALLAALLMAGGALLRRSSVL